MINAIIVLEWLAAGLGGIAFLAVFGWPWRYKDRTMAWHLVAVTGATVLEIVALLFAGTTLIPSLVAYGVGAGVVWWRVILLLRIRHKSRVG